MSNFNEVLTADAAGVFCNSGEFAEQVVYVKADGSTRTISAIVDRNPPETVTANGEVMTPLLTIDVANDAALGISSAEVDAGGTDRIRVARRIGMAAESFGIYLPPAGSKRAHDAGMISFDLR